MSLRSTSTFKPKPETVNCILMDGGLGDHIGSLVAVDYILKNYPWITLLIWVPDFLCEFAKNVLPETAIVRDFTAMKTKYNRNRPTITTKWDGITSPMKMHTVDYGFLKLCDEAVSLSNKNFLQVKFNNVDITALPEISADYGIITTGYTAKVREFNAEAVNNVVEFLLSKSITPVFLGQTVTKTGAAHEIKGTFKEDIDYSKGINLINKTSLLQAAKLMHMSKAVIGVDNGLLHIAGCTDAPIVAGYTTVRPELRAPIRHDTLGYKFYPVTPGMLLDCRFCQSDTNFLYGHDYKFCIYKDYECVVQLTGEKFINRLKEIL